MDYKQFLEVVKKQNPDMPYKDQQKAASEMLKKFKGAQEGFTGDPGNIDIPRSERAAGPEAFISSLAAAEKKLRENVIDVPGICTVGREVIPDGALVQHGKDGVNTRVTWQNDRGGRLPISGFFVVYL